MHKLNAKILFQIVVILNYYLNFELTKQILYEMHIGSALLNLVSRDDLNQFRQILLTLDSPQFFWFDAFALCICLQQISYRNLIG